MEIIKKAIERSVRKTLIDQGTYHPAYRNVITIFTDMLYEYIRLKNNDSKSDTMNEIENELIKDITAYGEQLKIDEQLIKSIITENESRMKLNERGVVNA